MYNFWQYLHHLTFCPACSQRLSIQTATVTSHLLTPVRLNMFATGPAMPTGLENQVSLLNLPQQVYYTDLRPSLVSTSIQYCML